MDWDTWGSFWGDDETSPYLPPIQTDYGPGIVGAVDANGSIVQVTNSPSASTETSPTNTNMDDESSGGFLDSLGGFFGDLGNIAAQGGKSAFQSYVNQQSGQAQQQQTAQTQQTAAQQAAAQATNNKTLIFGGLAILVGGIILYKVLKTS